MNTQLKAALFSQDNGFYKEIRANSAIEKEARINVYRNNIFVSLMDALADIFPVTQALVGEDFFRAMAREYILLHQPQSPVISEYGDTFSDFIHHFEPAQSLPFLGGLAKLEHSLLQLTNEQEYNTLEREQIAAAFENASDPAQLILALPPSSKVCTCPFAIGSIYQAHQSDATHKLRDIKTTNSEHLLLAKSHIYAKLYIISQNEAIFINNLLQGKVLGEAVPDNDNFDLGASLAKLIDWKLLIQVSEPSI
ncbi:HvfC/BufC N-terminal domain-containing protein [Marinomonas transparens]|uniref:DNA-binding domain-containing protein n=1 Tax=Marinomonas transparens TaxID=2795388 RepID=A0A934JMA5_9GAMM|nr:DNA-binding domain-containing protein [Marinomonas transparens]MBJ7536133.1 putative DNA-binding domain-containing protein [Marinomonas transparens]